ncbi:MAG: aminotransferase class V-fold PLP-dependent enzyme [Solirubrobacteraceae bacterium]
MARNKTAPHRMSDDSFWEVPAALKEALAPFIGASPEEIILGNSTSYGLHLLAHGLDWRSGDEVLLVEGDFPATVVPWLWLRERGVRVRMIEPRVRPLDVGQLADEISERTRLLCSSWVFSLTGEAVDLDAIGRLCQERGVLFVVNGTQAIGARPIDVHRSPVDALVSCGFKWLCGPYGTGFCWVQPDLLARLNYHQDYWLAHMQQSDLAREGGYELRDDLRAGRYDVFGTANFFAFVPWTAALELLWSVGVDAIEAHDQHLVEMIVSDLADSRRVRVLSPNLGPARSAIVMISHTDPNLNPAVYEKLRADGIDIALRAGNLRLSPHLHNSEHDVRQAVEAIAQYV